MHLLLIVLPFIVTVFCENFMSQFPVQADTSHDTEHLHPVIRDFQHLIESDAEIWLGFHQMFDEIPNTQEYFMDPSGFHPQVDICNNIKSIDKMVSRFEATNRCCPISIES